MRLRPCINPPPPPPVFVVCDMVMLEVIHASSPCADTTSSPCSSDTCRMGIVVPLISACMTRALPLTQIVRNWRTRSTSYWSAGTGGAKPGEHGRREDLLNLSYLVAPRPILR